jgi:hypothetical protein
MQDVTNPVGLPSLCSTSYLPFLLDSMQQVFIFHWLIQLIAILLHHRISKSFKILYLSSFLTRMRLTFRWYRVATGEKSVTSQLARAVPSPDMTSFSMRCTSVTTDHYWTDWLSCKMISFSTINATGCNFDNKWCISHFVHIKVNIYKFTSYLYARGKTI